LDPGSFEEDKLEVTEIINEERVPFDLKFNMKATLKDGKVPYDFIDNKYRFAYQRL
jgi:hypothetical protein